MLRSGGVLYVQYNENGCPGVELYIPRIFTSPSCICVYTTHACESPQVSKPTYPGQKLQNALHCSLFLCAMVDILEEINRVT